MLLDLDSLDAVDYDALCEVLAQASSPYGYGWPEGTRPLEKLVGWAAWGVHVQREAAADLENDSSPPLPRFDPDSLYHGEWEVIEQIDREPTGPDGARWPRDATTLSRLAAWARAGRSTRKRQG